MLSYIFAAVTGLLVLIADQFTKAFIKENFIMAKSYDFIPGIVDITYINNDGGAWGMLGGHTWILLSVTFVVMLVCVALLLKNGSKDKLMFWAMMLVLSGGIGNMIDRIFRGGNVIDFLHLEFMPTFPVFNIADCAIVIGACLLVLYFAKGMIDDEKAKRKQIQEVIEKAQENADN